MRSRKSCAKASRSSATCTGRSSITTSGAPYTPRFGLYSIDFQTSLDRLLREPSGDRPAETYAALIREAASKGEMV